MAISPPRTTLAQLERAARALLLGVLLVFGLGLPVARADVPVPPLKSRVTDLVGTLAPQDAAALEQKLAAFEQKKGSQVAVLIVPTVQPEVIEQYAIRVADAWKLGRKGVDDGAILIVAMNDKKLRIEVGRGLEGPVPDAVAKRIIADEIVPKFRQQDFAGGINAGVDRLLRVIDGEPLPAPKETATQSFQSAMGDDFETLLIVGLVMVLLVGSILRSLLGQFGGAAVAGGGAGVIGYVLVSSLFAAFVVGIIVFGMTMIFGMGGWRGGGGRSVHHSGGWGHSSSGGSWGSSSSSGGGFSGGGGDFGGGGASGDW